MVNIRVYDSGFNLIYKADNSNGAAIYSLNKGELYYVGLNGYRNDKEYNYCYNVNMIARLYSDPSSVSITVSKDKFLEGFDNYFASYMNITLTRQNGTTEKLTSESEYVWKDANDVKYTLFYSSGDEDWNANEYYYSSPSNAGDYTFTMAYYDRESGEYKKLGSVDITIMSFAEYDFPTLGIGENKVHSAESYEEFDNNIYKFTVPYEGKIEISEYSEYSIYTLKDGVKTSVSNNGTLIPGNQYFIQFYGSCYDNDTKKWKYDFSTTVRAVPSVKEISVANGPKTTDFIRGMDIDIYEGVEIKVTYSNGETETVTGSEGDFYDRYGTFYDKTLIHDGKEFTGSVLPLGETEVVISLSNEVKCSYTINAHRITEYVKGTIYSGSNKISTNGEKNSYYKFTPSVSGIYEFTPNATGKTLYVEIKPDKKNEIGKITATNNEVVTAVDVSVKKTDYIYGLDHIKTDDVTTTITYADGTKKKYTGTQGIVELKVVDAEGNDCGGIYRSFTKTGDFTVVTDVLNMADTCKVNGAKISVKKFDASSAENISLGVTATERNTTDKVYTKVYKFVPDNDVKVDVITAADSAEVYVLDSDGDLEYYDDTFSAVLYNDETEPYVSGEYEITYKDNTTGIMSYSGGNNYDTYRNVIQCTSSVEKVDGVDKAVVELRYRNAGESTWNYITKKYVDIIKKHTVVKELTEGVTFDSSETEDEIRYFTFKPQTTGRYVIKTESDEAIDGIDVTYGAEEWVEEENSAYYLNAGVIYKITLNMYFDTSYKITIQKALAIVDVEVTGYKGYVYKGIEGRFDDDTVEIKVTFADGTTENITGNNPLKDGRRCNYWAEYNEDDAAIVVELDGIRTVKKVAYSNKNNIEALVFKNGMAYVDVPAAADGTYTKRYIYKMTIPADGKYNLEIPSYEDTYMAKAGKAWDYPDNVLGNNLKAGDVYYLSISADIEYFCVSSVDANKWQVVKEATCTENGQERRYNPEIGEFETRVIPATGHSYSKDWTVVKTAEYNKDGYRSHKCTKCGAMSNAKNTINKITSVKLGTTVYAYDGKVKKPSVVVKDSKGKTVNNKNYTVTYKNNKAVGKAKIVKVTGAKKSNVTIAKLAKKKYYVRVRSFKKVGNTTYYSAWSKKTNISIKK